MGTGGLSPAEGVFTNGAVRGASVGAMGRN